MTPPGTGDINLLIVVQAVDTGGTLHDVSVREVRKGSTGLSGSFLINYFSLSGPRKVSFEESSSRLMMKLREMSTIGYVYVTRDCYPNCSSGGWGAVATPMSPGIIGGYQWTIHFLKNPGISYGQTFPNGSGNIAPPTIDSSQLAGTGANAESTTLVEGSIPLTGAFQLDISDEMSEPMPYNTDSITIEQSLHDLRNTGRVSVRSGHRAMKLIEGITAAARKDASILEIRGGDLREHLAPGDKFRVGGAVNTSIQGELDGADGAELIGLATLYKGSPLIFNSELSVSGIAIGENVRIGGEMYKIVRNGIEVQQLTVHRVSGHPDAYFYQLKAKVGGFSDTTPCLMFDASAEDVESALNSLSVTGINGVVVTQSEGTTGIPGNAHLYRIYFQGTTVLGNVNKLVVEDCVSGLPPGIDGSNSHYDVRTLVHGGVLEHQQIALSSDSGTTIPVPAFQVTISDSLLNSVSTPCIEWESPTLDLNYGLSASLPEIVSTVVPVTTIHLSSDLYDIEVSDFIEGAVIIGDNVKLGVDCSGIVTSLGNDGKQ